MRDKTKEMQPLYGVTPVNKVAHLDSYIGPFADLSEALTKVPDNMREVSKFVTLYTDASNTVAELYMWCTDLSGTWGLQPVNNDQELYQILSLGSIVRDAVLFKVTVNLPRIQVNQVRLNGYIYQRGTISEFTFDPIVTSGNLRRDIIEARPDSTLFYLKKGTESPNPVAPTVTSGGMLIAEVLVTASGAVSTPMTNIVTDLTLRGKGTASDPLGVAESLYKTTVYQLPVTQDSNIHYLPFAKRVNLDWLHNAVNVSTFDNFKLTKNTGVVGTVRNSISELQDDIDALTNAEVLAGYMISFRVVLQVGKSEAGCLFSITDI